MRVFSFMVLIALLTIAGVTFVIHSQTTPRPLRSFLVTTVMSSPEQGSPYLHTSTLAQAVRSDGSWVRISTRMIGGQEQYARDIHDFESGVWTIVDDTTRSVVQGSIRPKEYKHRLEPSVSCEGTPAGQILGVAVSYSETTQDITGNPQGDATALIKRWVAQDLGCFVLKKETRWNRKSDGVLLVDTKITPIAVSFEKVDQFFEIPASYTKRTRKEALDLLTQQLNQLNP